MKTKKLLLFAFLLLPAMAALVETDEADSFDEALAQGEEGGIFQFFAIEPLVATFDLMFAEPVQLLIELVTEMTVETFEESPTGLQYGIAFLYFTMLVLVFQFTPDAFITAPVSPIIVLVLLLGYVLYVNPALLEWVVGFFERGFGDSDVSIGLSMVILVVAIIMGALLAGPIGGIMGAVVGAAAMGFGSLIVRLLLIPLLIMYAFVDMLVQTLFNQPLSAEFVIVFIFPLAMTYSLTKGLMDSMDVFSQRTTKLLGLLTLIIFAKTGYNPLVSIFGGLLQALGLMNSGMNPVLVVVNVFLIALAFLGGSMILSVAVALEEKEMLDAIKEAEEQAKQEATLNALSSQLRAGTATVSGFTPPGS